MFFEPAKNDSLANQVILIDSATQTVVSDRTMSCGVRDPKKCHHTGATNEVESRFSKGIGE